MQKNGFAEVGDARFYYEIAGEGPPLVLVHAGIADGRMWDEQLQEFAALCRLLAAFSEFWRSLKSTRSRKLSEKSRFCSAAKPNQHPAKPGQT